MFFSLLNFSSLWKMMKIFLLTRRKKWELKWQSWYASQSEIGNFRVFPHDLNMCMKIKAKYPKCTLLHKDWRRLGARFNIVHKNETFVSLSFIVALHEFYFLAGIIRFSPPENNCSCNLQSTCVCAKGAFFIPFRHSPILSASYIYSLCLFLGISHSSSAFHFTMRSNRVYIKPMCTCSVSGLFFILRDLRNKANEHKHTSVFQHNETQCMQLVFPERIFPFSIPLGAFILSLFLFYLVKTLSFFWQLFTYFICMIPLPLSV